MSCSKQSAKRLFLTATPFVNSIDDLVNLATVLTAGRGTISRSNVFDALQGKVIFQPKVISDDFPKVKEEYVYIDMDEEYQKAYISEMKDGEEFTSNAFYNAYRRAVNSLGDSYTTQKIQAIIDIINDHPERRSVVYTNWIKYGVKTLTDSLNDHGITYEVIAGTISQKERQRIVDAYNNGKVDVLIITAAGSEGIDLKETENIFVLDPVWHPAGIEQIIGRGVRYKSHINLPPERRVVHVYFLILKEYDIELDNLGASASGDIILYGIINGKKEVQNEIYEKLKEISY